MSNKKMIINLIANFLSLIVSVGVNLLLTPYIVNRVGSEAYGFVSLANNFIMYLSLITVALNSMAGRYIAIEIHKKNLKKANKYFTSVVFANLFLVAILFIPLTFLIINLDNVIKISFNLVSDVKILFSIIIINFFITIITSVFSVAVFVKNKLYLSSLRGIEGNIIRVFLLIILFMFLPIKVYYIGIASLTVLLYTTYFNIFYTKKFTPDLKINKQYFNVKMIREIASAGIWNVVSQISSILNEGLDLLICNIFLGPTIMGTLAIAKTIPNMMMSVIGNLAGVFTPDLTKEFANNNCNGLVRVLEKSTKLMGIFITVPIAGVIVFGDVFFNLWVPTQNSQQLQILSFLSIACLIITGSTASIYSVFTVTNKLKTNSMVTLGIGIANTIIVFILLKTTNLGVYAVAGVSTITAILKNLFFTFPYAAKCINQKWYVFYPMALRNLFSVVIVSIVCIVVKSNIYIDGWEMLILSGIISGGIGVILNIFIVFSKKEKIMIIEKIKFRFKK